MTVGLAASGLLAIALVALGFYDIATRSRVRAWPSCFGLAGLVTAAIVGTRPYGDWRVAVAMAVVCIAMIAWFKRDEVFLLRGRR